MKHKNGEDHVWAACKWGEDRVHSKTTGQTVTGMRRAGWALVRHKLCALSRKVENTAHRAHDLAQTQWNCARSRVFFFWWIKMLHLIACYKAGPRLLACQGSLRRRLLTGKQNLLWTPFPGGVPSMHAGEHLLTSAPWQLTEGDLCWDPGEAEL